MQARITLEIIKKILRTPICDIPKINAIGSIPLYSYEFRYDYGGWIHKKNQILQASIYRTPVNFSIHFIYDEELFMIRGTGMSTVMKVEVSNSKRIGLDVLFSREENTILVGKEETSIKELYYENK